MCLKMLLCSEASVAPVWCLAAMETAFGASYRVRPRGGSISPLDTPPLQNDITTIVIEQISRFIAQDVCRLIEWCQVHDKVVLACGVLTDEEREKYGLSHGIELEIIAPLPPRCIQWTSCAGTLHLFDEMLVPTLKTAQCTAHLYCSGQRCQRLRSRPVTCTQRPRTPLKGPERRKSPIGHFPAGSFPHDHSQLATRQ